MISDAYVSGNAKLHLQQQLPLREIPQLPDCYTCDWINIALAWGYSKTGEHAWNIKRSAIENKETVGIELSPIWKNHFESQRMLDFKNCVIRHIPCVKQCQKCSCFLEHKIKSQTAIDIKSLSNDQLNLLHKQSDKCTTQSTFACLLDNVHMNLTHHPGTLKVTRLLYFVCCLENLPPTSGQKYSCKVCWKQTRH